MTITESVLLFLFVVQIVTVLSNVEREWRLNRRLANLEAADRRMASDLAYAVKHLAEKPEDAGDDFPIRLWQVKGHD